MDVHMLWVEGELNPREWLCLSSFCRKGYSISLWSYGSPAVPSGCRVRNAREVLPEDAIFLNRRGSYASFSDWFRYAVLHRFGGLYSDVDVIAVKPASHLPEEAFLVTEACRKGPDAINNNVIFNPDPKQGNLIYGALQYAQEFPKESIVWSEIGPTLLTKLEKNNPDHGFRINSAEFANPISWWNCPTGLLDEAVPLHEDTQFLHLYNEMWRIAKVDANLQLSDQSLIMRAYHA